MPSPQKAATATAAAAAVTAKEFNEARSNAVPDPCVPKIMMKAKPHFDDDDDNDDDDDDYSFDEYSKPLWGW